MTTKAKATPNTKATTKSKAKKATTPKPATKATTPTEKALTEFERQILTTLEQAGVPLTRADLAKSTGRTKGYSRTLGASSKADGGIAGDRSLTARGLVKAAQVEGERSFTYTITAAGKRALKAAE